MEAQTPETVFIICTGWIGRKMKGEEAEKKGLSIVSSIETWFLNSLLNKLMDCL